MIQAQTFDSEAGKKQIEKDSYDYKFEINFWQYYSAWASILYDLPLGFDLKVFQKNRSKELSDDRALCVESFFDIRNPQET